MTKVDIIENIYEKVGFSKKEVAKIVESIFDIIKETFKRRRRSRSPGSEILWSGERGRGGAETRRRETTLRSRARRILTFKPSQVLKGGLNRRSHTFQSSIEPAFWLKDRGSKREIGQSCSRSRNMRTPSPRKALLSDRRGEPNYGSQTPCASLLGIRI